MNINQAADKYFWYYCPETFKRYTVSETSSLSFLCICCWQARCLIGGIESEKSSSDLWTNYADVAD